MRAPLLNVDAGELEDEPDALYREAELVNVACGGHAGDARSMERVVRIAHAAGSRIGAHPSYPDREGFGRRTVAMTPDALELAMEQQCESLATVARGVGDARVMSVKPHGALYHDANRDPSLARAVVRAAKKVYGDRVVVIGPPSGALSEAAREAGLAFWREGFADRGVRADGSLVPRGEPGALVTDPRAAAERALELARSGAVDTICVHGDTEGAITVVSAVRDALSRMSVRPARMEQGVPLGDRGWRYPRPSWSSANPADLFARLRALPGVVDVVVTEQHVALFRDATRERVPNDAFEENVSRALGRAPADADGRALTQAPRVHVIGVRYDGPDLDDCATRLGLSCEALVAIHASGTYEVKMIGFMPGFAYLGDLDPRLVLPRRDAPRTRVAPASVAIADEYTAVYPFASPGGWHLLGTATSFEPFNLALGDRVRFEPR